IFATFSNQQLRCNRAGKLPRNSHGVWVDIQYTSEEAKVDSAGHVHQLRQAQERVVLTALQRCITHKVRRIKNYLSYTQLQPVLLEK
ncbi:MAG: hypothetical protein F6K19_39770, partial [Cyanothece sp. SIO1E1]|nr:hypothetical protein [Cyanothece sp. SIO1E1]